MSASLVGSEMCIRDSPPMAENAQEGASPQARRPFRALLGLPPDRSSTTVSYTHLTLPTICSV
eukprot:5679283-Alexandrium_andersonii.AAC.1